MQPTPSSPIISSSNTNTGTSTTTSTTTSTNPSNPNTAPNRPPPVTKCSTCLSPNPKYRCPGCNARSCSLGCVKTHKARTLCSGVRNATRFLSRHQLATPQAFDSDFNLLAGIERGVERAERVFALALDRDGRGEGEDGEKALVKAVAAAGVRVWNAPRGVLRARENATGVEGRKRTIRWTLEWRILGRRVLSSALESGSLDEACDIALLDVYRAERAERAERSTKGGDREESRASAREYIEAVGVLVPEGYKGRRELMAELGLRQGVTDEHDLEQQHQQDDTTLTSTRGTGSTISRAKRRYFIHRPEISTAQKQMVAPVDGQTSLRDILRGRTVREFPTFLVEVSGFDEVDWSLWRVADERDDGVVVGRDEGRT